MRILSVNVGRPQIMVRGERRVSTAINRRPTPEPVPVTPEGLAGDRVSDDRVHGGPDKAVCVFPHEHYAACGDFVGQVLQVPAFGENLTTTGLLETEVCLGDRFRVGAGLFEVSQPRQPCLKLAMKHSAPQLPRWLNEREYSGFYLRVIVPGAVQAGDAVALEARPHPEFSVARLTRLIARPPSPAGEVRAVLALPELSAAWRVQLERRLAGEDELPE